MAKVFVINQPQTNNKITYDISPALEYGDIVFIFQNDHPSPSEKTNWAINRAHEVLKNITLDDYLVWAGGDPFSMAICAPIAADYLCGKIRYLKWQKNKRQGERGGYYAPVTATIFDEE